METTEDMKAAMAALLRLTAAERGLVLCWFDPATCEYVPPGGKFSSESGL
jgi:hypothetical protein